MASQVGHDRKSSFPQDQAEISHISQPIQEVDIGDICRCSRKEAISASVDEGGRMYCVALWDTVNVEVVRIGSREDWRSLVLEVAAEKRKFRGEKEVSEKSVLLVRCG